MDKLDPKDGGMLSRKLWVVIGTSLLIFLGALLSIKWPVFSANYSLLIGGLLGSAGLYAGSNVGAQYVTGRHLNDRVKIELNDTNKGINVSPPIEPAPPDFDNQA